MKIKKIISAIAIAGILSTSAITMASAVTGRIGDVNGDNSVNISDVTAVQKYLVGMYAIRQDRLSNADADQNGDVNINDATTIQLYLAGLYQFPDDDVIHLPFVPAK